MSATSRRPSSSPREQLLLAALDQLDRDARVRMHERAAQARRDERRERHEAAELQRAGQLLRQLGGEALEAVGVAQQLAGALEQLAAGRGGGDALRVVADQQLHVERGLELRDRRRHRRLRDRDAQRGLGHAARVAGRDEVLELPQGEAHGRSLQETCLARFCSFARDPVGGRGIGVERAAHVVRALRAVDRPEREQAGDRVVAPVDAQVDLRPGHGAGHEQAGGVQRPGLAAGRRRPRAGPRAGAPAAGRTPRRTPPPPRRAPPSDASRFPAATHAWPTTPPCTPSVRAPRPHRAAPGAVDHRELAVLRVRPPPRARQPIARLRPASQRVEQRRPEPRVGHVLRRRRADAGPHERAPRRHRRRGGRDHDPDLARTGSAPTSENVIAGSPRSRRSRPATRAARAPSRRCPVETGCTPRSRRPITR